MPLEKTLTIERQRMKTGEHRESGETRRTA
jgi:hypothetical protein